MPPENEAQETSMRDDFDAAIIAIEKDEDGAITTQTAEEAALAAGDLNDDEEGQKAEAQAKTEAEAKEILSKKSESEKDDDDDTSTVGDVKPVDLSKDDDDKTVGKAPESWTPAMREGWKGLTSEMRSQIGKRETEINKALMEGSDHRKTGEQFTALASQYAQVIAAEGATSPLQGVEELMKTVATLRMGSPEQKVAKIAGFIKHYGIPIDMLDKALSSQIGGKPDENADLSRLINDRMKPMDDFLARMTQNEKTANLVSNQKAIDDTIAFKQDHEFYADVQDDMADLVEMADRRKQPMTLQSAYDKACAMNTQITTILTKRAADAALISGKSELEKKREAASSIMGKQGGPVVTDAEKDSMRDTISAAFDAQVG